LATVDLAIFATAAPAAVVTEAPRRTTPLLILDLAVPRDVAAAVGSAPMITLVDIEGLRAEGRTAVAADVAAAEAIVEAEVAAFVAWHREADVAPTVAALRARAEDVVVAELRRLTGRLPDLTDDDRAEVARTVHRVVRRLLHEPTVRVRQRATEPGGQAYATVLRELFDLAVPDDPDSGSGLNVPGALAAPSVESAPLSDPAREEQ
jgi:glutamyl-tRNA reductase